MIELVMCFLVAGGTVLYAWAMMRALDHRRRLDALCPIREAARGDKLEYVARAVFPYMVVMCPVGTLWSVTSWPTDTLQQVTCACVWFCVLVALAVRHRTLRESAPDWDGLDYEAAQLIRVEALNDKLDQLGIPHGEKHQPAVDIVPPGGGA